MQECSVFPLFLFIYGKVHLQFRASLCSPATLSLPTHSSSCALLSKHNLSLHCPLSALPSLDVFFPALFGYFFPVVCSQCLSRQFLSWWRGLPTDGVVVHGVPYYHPPSSPPLSLTYNSPIITQSQESDSLRPVIRVTPASDVGPSSEP